MKTLTFTIAEPWFTMICEGKKKEEYREITDYYRSRFFDGWDKVKANGFYWCNDYFQKYPKFKLIDEIILRNGYHPASPKVALVNPKIRIDKGKEEWGARPYKFYFVITWERIEVLRAKKRL